MVITTIDFETPGKQQDFLRVPYSHNLGGWANVMIPITTITNGEGPTVLILGGNHGDEYQGQIAAMKLARELTPEMVTGRVILIPCPVVLMDLTSIERLPLHEDVRCQESSDSDLYC